MADTITVHECEQCEGRGRTTDDIRHLLICTDPSQTRALTFVIGEGPAKPLF